jgi:hypothetical protein
MLDPDLAQAILEGRAARNDITVPDQDPKKPSFARYSEGTRLFQELPGYGYDMDQVRHTLLLPVPSEWYFRTPLSTLSVWLCV